MMLAARAGQLRRPEGQHLLPHEVLEEGRGRLGGGIIMNPNPCRIMHDFSGSRTTLAVIYNWIYCIYMTENIFSLTKSSKRGGGWGHIGVQTREACCTNSGLYMEYTNWYITRSV